MSILKILISFSLVLLIPNTGYTLDKELENETLDYLKKIKTVGEMCSSMIILNLYDDISPDETIKKNEACVLFNERRESFMRIANLLKNEKDKLTADQAIRYGNLIFEIKYYYLILDRGLSSGI